MIFLSEQPQTGMNEGTWFTQGRCIKKTKEYFVGKGGDGGIKNRGLRWSPLKFCCWKGITNQLTFSCTLQYMHQDARGR